MSGMILHSYGQITRRFTVNQCKSSLNDPCEFSFSIAVLVYWRLPGGNFNRFNVLKPMMWSDGLVLKFGLLPDPLRTRMIVS